MTGFRRTSIQAPVSGITHFLTASLPVRLRVRRRTIWGKEMKQHYIDQDLANNELNIGMPQDSIALE